MVKRFWDMDIITETMEFYANDYHMTILGSVRPIICAPEYVRKMRRSYYSDIEKVLGWDDEMKENLIDVLTDVVSVPALYSADLHYYLDEVERKLEELKEFEEFKRLKGYFDYLKKTDPNQARKIIKIAVNRIISHIDTILRELILQMLYVDEDSVKELFIVGSMLRLIRNLLEIYLRKEDSRLLLTSTFLTLRFASYIKKKISLSDLQSDISFCVDLFKVEEISDEVLRDVVCSIL